MTENKSISIKPGETMWGFLCSVIMWPSIVLVCAMFCTMSIVMIPLLILLSPMIALGIWCIGKVMS